MDGILETIDKHVKNQSRRFPFSGKWRNVVMPYYIWKDRQDFTLSVPLSDNVWAKRTMYHNEISIHRLQEFTIFSQISEKNVHAKLLRCTCSTTVFKWLETVILKCCEWTKYFCSKKREICPEFGNKISPPTKITVEKELVFWCNIYQLKLCSSTFG